MEDLKEGKEALMTAPAPTNNVGAVVYKMRMLAIMPTMRWRNWPKVMEHLRAAALEAPAVELTFCPVLTEAEVSGFPQWAMDMVTHDETWSPMLLRPLVVNDPQHPRAKIADQKIESALYSKWKPVGRDDVPCVKEVMRKNHAAVAGLEDFDGYIWTGSDDNLVPRSFCRRFAEGINKKIIVGCHKRGSGPGASGHGISDLVAEPASMRVGSVSGEQYIIRADVLRGRTLLGSGCPDGQLMADLIAEMPQEFHFIRDFWIPFNALEEGRWRPGEVEKLLAV